MLSAAEVQERATSPIEACKVSLEVWTERAGLPNEELPKASLGPRSCGLCVFYGWSGNISICDINGKGDCLLSETGQVCCAEFDAARKARNLYSYGEATAAQVRSAFWLMVARLETELAKLEAAQAEEIRLLADTAEKLKQEAEKQATKKAEREIRHGDFGVDFSGPTLAVTDSTGRLVKSRHSGRVDCKHANIQHCQFPILGNIFDLMAEAMKGKTEYIVAGVDFKLVGDTITINQPCVFSSQGHVAKLLQAVVSLAIQHKLAEAQKGKCDA